MKPAILRILYAPRAASVSSLYAPWSENFLTRQPAAGRRFLMSILDGVSLLLAVALFGYLMVALLRADRG